MFLLSRPRNFRYVGVYLPPENGDSALDTEYWAALAKFIHETFGHLTRAVYLSCGGNPTAKITLGRFLDGYNTILLEGGKGSASGNEDLEMLIAAETGLILLGGENTQSSYIARHRNKPETTYCWKNKKTGFAGSKINPHEPRNCPASTRIQAAEINITSGALAEFPR